VTITIDDGSLEKGCPYCKQSGKVINPKFMRWQLDDFEGEQPKEVVILCPICNGLGVISTSMGFSLLDFIDKHGRNL